MDSNKKLFIGFDLSEDYSQISCYSYKTFEPIPISLTEKEEKYFIPTALCVEKDTKRWLIGDEATTCDRMEAGYYVASLIEKLQSQEEKIIIYQTKFSAEELLEKFFRKTLLLVKTHFPTEAITKLVVTIQDTKPEVINGIYKALSGLGIERDRALVIDRSSSYLYYALSQDKTLWNNDIGLFDYGPEGLFYYQITINRRTVPMIAAITKKDLSDIMDYSLVTLENERLPYIFENAANTVLYKQVLSALYFTGRGFENGWAYDVIKTLCKGRRAFLGQNLYCFGACYAAKELSGDTKLNQFLLLTDDMIASDIAIRVYNDGRIKEAIIVEAAKAWYEVKANLEVIPEDEQDIELILHNIITRQVRREKLSIKELPIRQDKTSRLRLEFNCSNKETVHIVITEVGFGELYPPTNQKLEYSIKLNTLM